MKIVDQIYHCQMPGQVFGIWQLQCHLYIFQPHTEVQVVLITDMGFEMGWFIPYVVEKLMEQIVHEFQLDTANLIWLEHYTSSFRKPTGADFSQVVVEWCHGQAKNPRWVEISPQTVKTLLGEGPSQLPAEEVSV